MNLGPIHNILISFQNNSFIEETLTQKRVLKTSVSRGILYTFSKKVVISKALLCFRTGLHLACTRRRKV